MDHCSGRYDNRGQRAEFGIQNGRDRCGGSGGCEGGNSECARTVSLCRIAPDPDVSQAVPSTATYWSLLPPLAAVGGDLLVDVLRRMRDGTVSEYSQDQYSRPDHCNTPIWPGQTSA